MKRIAILFLTLMAATGFENSRARPVTDGAPADSLTLKQVIEGVLQHQPKLDRVAAEVDAAKAQERQVQTAYSPQVDAELSYTRVDPVPSFDLNGHSVSIAPNNNYDGHFSVRQMIYDFGRTEAAMDLAGSRTKAAEDQSGLVKWNLSFYAARTYYSILFLQESIRVQKEQISTLKQDLGLVKRRVQSGAATDYDVLTTRVQISRQQSRLTDLENNLAKQRITLRKLLGWNAGRPVVLKGSLQLDEQRALAMVGQELSPELRPDYKLLMDRQELARKQKQQVALDDKPKVNGLLNAGVMNGYPLELNKPYLNWALGVQVTVPIFNGHRNEYKSQQAQAQLQAVEAQQADKRREMSAEVQQAESDILSGLKKLDTTHLEVEQAQQKVKLAKVRYQSGVITNQDLLDSETALLQARLSEVSLKYRIRLSEYQLKKASGEQIW